MSLTIPGADRISDARQLREEGLTFRAIAERLGISPMDAHRWCQPDFTPARTPRGTPFWDRMDKSNGPDSCWEWQAGRQASGYGSVKVDGRTMTAHRRAYELTHGPIPDGLVIRHRCDNPPCCNPAHLETGTVKENADDRVERGRGHVQPKGKGHRWGKFSDAVIADVVRLKDEGLTNVEIAERTGVSASYVSRITRRSRR